MNATDTRPCAEAAADLAGKRVGHFGPKETVEFTPLSTATIIDNFKIRPIEGLGSATKRGHQNLCTRSTIRDVMRPFDVLQKHDLWFEEFTQVRALLMELVQQPICNRSRSGD